MTAVRHALRQLRYEQLIYWRTPAAVVFTIGMPVTMLVIFSTLSGDNRLEEAGGMRFAQYFAGGMIAFGVMSATYGNLAARFVFRRETGVLKRMRATPLPTSAFVAALVLNAVVVVAIVTSIVLAAAVAFFDVTVPDRWPLLVLTVLLGAAVFSALGVAAANLIPNADTADAVIFGTLMPLLFISGAFDPIPPGLMADISDLFPVRHLVAATLRTFDPRPGLDAPVGNLLALAAWGAAAGAFALRRFRWESSRG